MAENAGGSCGMVQFFVHTAAAELFSQMVLHRRAADMKMPETCIQMGREIMLSSRETDIFISRGHRAASNIILTIPADPICRGRDMEPVRRIRAFIRPAART